MSRGPVHAAKDANLVGGPGAGLQTPVAVATRSVPANGRFTAVPGLGTAFATIGGTMRFRAGAAVLLVVVALAACQQHPAKSVSYRSVVIGERGISIPVPPPSLRAEPEQETRVEGEVELEDGFALDELEPGAIVHMHELVRGTRGTAEVFEREVGEEIVLGFEMAGFVVDHSDNCFEFTVKSPAGVTTAPQRYHTAILASDTEIETRQGCP